MTNQPPQGAYPPPGANPPPQGAYPPPQPQQLPPQPTPPPKKKRRIGLVIAIVLASLLVLAGGAFGVYYWYVNIRIEKTSATPLSDDGYLADGYARGATLVPLEQAGSSTIIAIDREQDVLLRVVGQSPRVLRLSTGQPLWELSDDSLECDNNHAALSFICLRNTADAQQVVKIDATGQITPIFDTTNHPYQGVRTFGADDDGTIYLDLYIRGATHYLALSNTGQVLWERSSGGVPMSESIFEDKLAIRELESVEVSSSADGSVLTRFGTQSSPTWAPEGYVVYRDGVLRGYDWQGNELGSSTSGRLPGPATFGTTFSMTDLLQPNPPVLVKADGSTLLYDRNIKSVFEDGTALSIIADPLSVTLDGTTLAYRLGEELVFTDDSGTELRRLHLPSSVPRFEVMDGVLVATDSLDPFYILPAQ